MLYVLEDAINGILIGSIYGLTAMGLTVIFGVLKVINFAHGSMLMVGMYVAYWAVTLTGIHPYLALIIVAPVMYLFGYLSAGHHHQTHIQSRKRTSANRSRSSLSPRGSGISWTTFPCSSLAPSTAVFKTTPCAARCLSSGE